MTPTATIVDSYRLSHMQQGMLFHHLLAPNAGADIEQMIIDLPELLDLPAFAQAWQTTMQQHEVLRTAFRWEGLPEPRQDLYDEVTLPLQEHDWRTLAADELGRRFQTWLAADRSAGFALDQPPLARLNLFHLAGATARVVWTFHHILLDGRSFPIVLRDLFTVYEAVRAGQTVTLAPTTPYKQFVEWLHAVDLAPAESFLAATATWIYRSDTVGDRYIGHGTGRCQRLRRRRELALRRVDQRSARAGKTSRRHHEHAGARRVGAAAQPV